MIYAVVLAGGDSNRMGSKTNKVLLPLEGVPAIVRSIQAFCDLVDGVVLVTRPCDLQRMQELSKAYQLPITAFASSGYDRQASVQNGLQQLPEECEFVLVHDGARALVSREVIQEVIASVKKHGSGVAATPVNDTIKVADEEGFIAASLDRKMLRAMQTPQGFTKVLLEKAHLQAEKMGIRGTDEAEIVALLPHRVHLTHGSFENIKLTTPSDFVAAQTILSKRGKDKMQQSRIGQGYDVHQLVPNRKLVLCGVDIPHELGLLGHSDADVALHALMDALLGAAGLYDIGRHFPDTAKAFENANSMHLLEKVVQMLLEKGFVPVNCDLTIVAQRPKLLQYIDTMRANIARVLGLAVEYVNVKATTTERLGFEGEEKGISALAVCLIKSEKGRFV